MPTEFELIRRYFARPAKHALLGVGDDAALLEPSPGMALAVSADMLVAGTHFFPDADPRALGHKALAVNLSDMAAMGAAPRWALLSLALPSADSAWLKRFAGGFLALARAFDVDLVGGDTTRGPLNLSVTIVGEVPPRASLRRDAARPGDDVWVSGSLGEAALGVAHGKGRVTLAANELARCMCRLERPTPRIALGIALRGIAHAAIDISDGLAADLGHICVRSKLGADVHVAQVPRSPLLARLGDRAAAHEALLAGGDDYELCFTAPVRRRGHVQALSTQLGLPLTRIGTMRRGRGVRLLRADGAVARIGKRGFDHFG
ncbi:MAG: thiamine-phosphate kinase [Betaproteobacteria bacterium]|nr:thiamine-phosphate kinase [Betaproteobacteria bacterium]